MKLRITLSGAIILLVAIALVVYGSTRPVERTFHGKLEELLPPPPAGWARTLRLIADTPEMQKAVGEILDYDDGVFVDYTRGSDRLSVYIAYWTPGKMQHRQVASHTPDVCWKLAGWKCVISDTLTDQEAHGRKLLAIQSRAFLMNNTTEYVWYWHIVGDEPKSYATTDIPPWYAAISDMIKKGLRQREEQFFIRLSSPQPLDNPSIAPALIPLLPKLPIWGG